MAVKLPKLSKKVLTIIIAVVALLVIIGIISMIAALVGDTNRLRYEIITQEFITELEAQTPDRQFACLDSQIGTYAVVDVKDTYRGGIFAKEKLVVPSEYKGKKVSSIVSLQNMRKIKELVISDGIVNITNSAFYGCSFTQIDIPGTVEYIGTYAFKECRSLEAITLPAGVTTISEGLFSECRALTSVTLLGNINTIGEKAFDNCLSLSLKTESGAKYLSNGTNDYFALVEPASADITECVINGATKIIATSAFADCKNLTTVTISDGVTYIPDHMFYGCKALTEIEIPDTVTSMGSYAFAGCTALTSVEIGAGLTEIPTYAFSGCTSLVTIEIPTTVKVINNYAFNGCSKLENVTLNAGLEKLGGSIFASCTKLTSITFNGTKAQWNEIEMGTTTSTRWYRNANNLETVVCEGETGEAEDKIIEVK